MPSSKPSGYMACTCNPPDLEFVEAVGIVQRVVVIAVHDLMPTRYRLPVLVLDATGMRVSELEVLTWGDVDEPEGRWRVSAASAKTKRACWVPVPPTIFADVTALVPPPRSRQRRAGVRRVRGPFRTAITRACRAVGIPTFSPHDLRHRRASLWHLQGVRRLRQRRG